MRVIAFTDIHGSYDKVVGILSKESRFDLIIIGGDVTTNGTVDEATVAIRRFQLFKKPVLAVAGNMDSPSFDATFAGLGVNINSRGVVLDDVGFFGVAGSPFTPMQTPYEISEEEIQRRAETGWREVQPARWKVFVPHSPPRDTALDKIFLGKHVGSTAIREFVYQNQPDVLICGHIHESRGMDMLGSTKMVNCGSAGRGHYAIIDINDEIVIDLRG
jgi:putative phosphoesterase